MKVSEQTDFFKVIDNFSKDNDVESVCIFHADEKYQSARITIAIPTFKRISTLKETLESALNQRDFESYLIYVVDNNPQRDDETELFMQQYVGSRVSYYKNTGNLGMGGNWNRCILLTKTEWVCLLHDDDTIDSDYLNNMVPYLEFLPNVGILQSRKYRDKKNHIPKDYSLPYEKYSYLDFYNGNAIDVPSGIIYNKAKAFALGGFNQDYYPSLDCVFASFMSTQFNTYVINKELTWYREGIGNASKYVETQKGWFIVDYYLCNYILRKAGFPKCMAEIFAEYRCVFRAQADMEKWGTSFEIPIDKLPWKGYNIFLGKLINHFLYKYILKKRFIRSKRDVLSNSLFIV